MSSLVGDPTIRRQVMAVAREVLASDPTAPVSTIAGRAGVSRATFYRHFGSRDALLESIAHEPRPSARVRILSAAQDMLVRESLAALSMDELARASGVSRGTLYRIFPGKAFLLDGLVETYSPFEQVRQILEQHHEEAPDRVLPLIAAAVVGVAGERLGLLRAIFLEVSGGSETAIAGMRQAFGVLLVALVAYMREQMAAGTIRLMEPVLAVQAFIGPILIHLMTRQVIERVAGLGVSVDESVAELAALAARGLAA